MSTADAPALTGLARSAIAGALGLPAVSFPDSALFDTRRGAFVTLTIAQRLRGCIGRIEADRLVRVVVPEMACAAAFADPRFPRLTRLEFERAAVEVSLLGAPRVVASPDEVLVGTHGVIVSALGRRGLLLPQVAVEWNWTREELLGHACEKASLPRDAWRHPGLRLEVFTSDIFCEAD